MSEPERPAEAGAEEEKAQADQARALALLQATHKFPVDYHVSVIAMNVDDVITEMRAAVEEGLAAPLPDDAYQTVPSSGGRYASHRFRVPCETAEAVLELYARIRRVKGVVSIL